MEKILTIMIPTYNRRNQLERALGMLEKQTNQFFKVLIVDNASDYDVNQVLVSREKEFRDKCKTVVRNVNAGADFNIIDGICCCDTKWIWTLADDDIVLEDAVEKIYKYINQVKNFGCLNFALPVNMGIPVEGIKIIDSVDGFVDFYVDSYKRQSDWYGDLIFLSNKVYDLEWVRPFLQYAYKYIYTRVSTIAIYLKMLEQNVAYVLINSKVVDYDKESTRSWKIYEVVLASRTLRDIEFKISKEKYKDLLRCITFNIRYVYYLYFIESKDGKNIPYFFDQVYNGIYKYYLPFIPRVILKIIAMITRKDIGYKFIKSIMNSYYEIKRRRGYIS